MIGRLGMEVTPTYSHEKYDINIKAKNTIGKIGDQRLPYFLVITP